MKNLFTKFFKEEEGNIIEYVIVLAVIAVIIAALFPGLRGKIMSWFNKMLGNVDQGIGGSTGEACLKADGVTTGKITVDAATGLTSCN